MGCIVYRLTYIYVCMYIALKLYFYFIVLRKYKHDLWITKFILTLFNNLIRNLITLYKLLSLRKQLFIKFETIQS